MQVTVLNDMSWKHFTQHSAITSGWFCDNIYFGLWQNFVQVHLFITARLIMMMFFSLCACRYSRYRSFAQPQRITVPRLLGPRALQAHQVTVPLINLSCREVRNFFAHTIKYPFNLKTGLSGINEVRVRKRKETV